MDGGSGDGATEPVEPPWERRRPRRPRAIRPPDSLPQPQILHRNLIWGCGAASCYTATRNTWSQPSSSRGAVKYFAATPDALPQSHPESRRRRIFGRNPSYFAATSGGVAVPRDTSSQPQLPHCNFRRGCGAATRDASPQSRMESRCRQLFSPQPQILRREVNSGCVVVSQDTAISDTLSQPHLRLRPHEMLHRDPKGLAATPNGVTASRIVSSQAQILRRNLR